MILNVIEVSPPQQQVLCVYKHEFWRSFSNFPKKHSDIYKYWKDIFGSVLTNIMNLNVVCLYLRVVRAENASSGCNKISNKHGEARQAEEEESRWARANDGAQNILKTNMDVDTRKYYKC